MEYIWNIKIWGRSETLKKKKKEKKKKKRKKKKDE